MQIRSNPGSFDVVVLANGEAPLAPVAFTFPPPLVVAADGGARHATRLGLSVTDLVGDLDSIDPHLLAELTRNGTRVHRHPTDKDESDLELALKLAVTSAFAHVDTGRRPRLLVLGGYGGRVDHFAVNMAVLCGPATASAEVEALLGDTLVTVIRPGRAVTLSGAPDELVTLLAMHGIAGGVHTTGLLFPLDDEELTPGASRGLSNRFLGTNATVRVESGTVAAFQPHHLSHHDSRSIS